MKNKIENIVNNIHINKHIDYNDYYQLQNIAYENALLFFTAEKFEDILKEFLEDFSENEVIQIFNNGLDKLPKVWSRFDKSTLYTTYEMSYCDELGYIAIPLPTYPTEED